MHPVLSSKLELIRAASARHGVRSLAAFGSVLRSDFDPDRSDIDLLVDFGDADLGPWMSKFFAFQRELETILQRRIDLLLAGSPLNPYILATIEQGRPPLYVAA